MATTRRQRRPVRRNPDGLQSLLGAALIAGGVYLGGQALYQIFKEGGGIGTLLGAADDAPLVNFDPSLRPDKRNFSYISSSSPNLPSVLGNLIVTPSPYRPGDILRINISLTQGDGSPLALQPFWLMQVRIIVPASGYPFSSFEEFMAATIIGAVQLQTNQQGAAAVRWQTLGYEPLEFSVVMDSPWSPERYLHTDVVPVGFVMS